MCISWNSWWRCSIARTSKICLDWHQKSDFELNSNIHLRHSCNQNMQNIVTWGQNMSVNIEEFACISMGGLFSGVPPYYILFLYFHFEEQCIAFFVCVAREWGAWVITIKRWHTHVINFTWDLGPAGIRGRSSFCGGCRMMKMMQKCYLQHVPYWV